MYDAAHIDIINRILTNAILDKTHLASMADLLPAHQDAVAKVFDAMLNLGVKVLCQEWGLQATWLLEDLRFEHKADEHLHTSDNPFGFTKKQYGHLEIITGAHLHLDNNVIGYLDWSTALENIANGLAGRNINLVVDDYVAQIWEKITEAVMNGNLALFSIEKDTVVGKENFDTTNTVTQALGNEVPMPPDVVSTGYNTERLNKYNKNMANASLKDVVAALGESLDEVLNRRDIKPEEKICRDFLGVSPAETTDSEKKYPAFYIPLAIMGIEAVLKQKFDIVQTLNFDWERRIQPVGYKMFEVGYKTEKKMPTDAYYFCKTKNNGAPTIIVTEIRSTMSGDVLRIRCMTGTQNSSLQEVFLNDIKKWIDDNNYYRGQKIGADGRFLNVSTYQWDDIVLETHIKDNVFDDVVGFLNHAELYRINNLPFKRGLILYGKPGCGKTLLGKVIANQIQSSFIWVTAAQASSAEFIKELFALAREIAPTVLFFEDVDMYTVDRGHGVFNAKVGELLAQMDGMEENNGLIVVATTNRLDVIEKALAERPSRFDRRYCLDNISADTTKRMIAKKLENANLVDVSLDDIAEMVQGLNGCFIQEVVISAKRKAIIRGNVDAEGVVNLNKDILLESAAEVLEAFRLRKPDNFSNEILDDLSEVPCKDSCAWASDAEPVVLAKNEGVLTMATAKLPRNVNLTQAEKNEIDGEINGALSAVARFSEYNDEDAIESYISDSALESEAIAIAGVSFAMIDWKKLDKTNLRKLFRVLVLRKNVSKITGKGEDKLKDKALLGDLLHAMDMLSDRYYWVHAFARIATHFGLTVEIPFNPYKDQTSKDAALKVYAQLTGKVQSSKKLEDKVNRANNVFVPPTTDHGMPDYEFNQPKDKDNITKPWQMK